MTHKLGNLQVSALGLGCMGLNFGYGPAMDPPRQRSRSLESGSCRSGLLGKGYLTGTIDEQTEFAPGDFHNTIPRVTPEARRANRAAAANLSLTPADLEAIDEAAGKIAVSGARYPEALERMTGR